MVSHLAPHAIEPSKTISLILGIDSAPLKIGFHLPVNFDAQDGQGSNWNYSQSQSWVTEEADSVPPNVSRIHPQGCNIVLHSSFIVI